MSELQTSLGAVSSSECFYCGSDLSSCCGLHKFRGRRKCRYCRSVVCSNPNCSVNLPLLVTDRDSKASGRCCTYCRDFYSGDDDIILKGELQKRDETVHYCTEREDSCAYLVTIRRDTATPDATVSWEKLDSEGIPQSNLWMSF